MNAAKNQIKLKNILILAASALISNISFIYFAMHILIAEEYNKWTKISFGVNIG